MDNNEEIQTRRSEELEALQAFYGDQLLPQISPVNTEETVSINGPWFIRLTSSKSPHNVPTLEIRLSPNYPFNSPDELPEPILHNVDYHMTSAKKQTLLQELNDMYEPEMYMDVGILWAERCREEFVDVFTHSCDDGAVEEAASKVALEDTPSPMELSVMFLSYNHLLQGKSHKKEAQIVSVAAKMGLVGFITYGTPGIIGIIVSSNSSAGITATEADVVDFSKECSQIGKKCSILDSTMELNDDGIKYLEKNDKKTKNKDTQGKKLQSLLTDVLGEGRIAVLKQNNTTNVSITKKGLNSFASCAELKKVLVDRHGMDERLFQQIIGIA